MAQRAEEAATPEAEREPAVDPEQAALSLLKAQLGAHPVDS
jgi:DNA polymerase-3 subunit gamma/tau